MENYLVLIPYPRSSGPERVGQPWPRLWAGGGFVGCFQPQWALPCSPSGRQHLEKGPLVPAKKKGGGGRLISPCAAPQPLPEGVRSGHAWRAPMGPASSLTFHANIIPGWPAYGGVCHASKRSTLARIALRQYDYGKGGYAQALPTPY